MDTPEASKQKDQASLQEKLLEIRTQYIKQLPERISSIEKEWRECVRNNFPLSGLQNAHRMAHSLKGSGSTFGFDQITDKAAVLETIFSELEESGHKPENSMLNEVDGLLSRLRVILEHIHVDNDSVTSGVIARNKNMEEGVDSGSIYLLEDDNSLAEELSTQLGHFGYKVLMLSEPEELYEACVKRTPLAIIADIILRENNNGGLQAIDQCVKNDIPMPPVIFISSRNDFQARLQAVRRNSVAYLEKPVDFTKLVDQLDALSNAGGEDPHRVLIVDDSETLGAFYAATLEASGMVTEFLSEPKKILEIISEFNPELILMDMYMPDCDGMEVASVIRQDEACVGIPIVYISAETDVDKQLQAMSLGGDDFLIKPIKPEHLVSSVTSRVVRSRILRSLMVRDSLTGLLNHTKTKELLDHEINRAKRTGESLVFAMVDIDKFKSVNDIYGHPVGDRVIKSLARLLSQRLRQTDIVGRYGGEEFAIVMTATNINTATKVLNGVRDNFSQIRQNAGDIDFTSTFSCGLASYPACKDAASLIEDADRALYQAKQNGRNRVKIASGEK
jgi:diguanylate cyclase (GGDEF)-like protein